MDSQFALLCAFRINSGYDDFGNRGRFYDVDLNVYIASCILLRFYFQDKLHTVS